MKEVADIDGANGGQLERESSLTVLAFFLFGFFIYASFTLGVTGAQDILAGTFTQTSTVLAASIGPYFIVCLIGPYFLQMIPYSLRISVFGLALLSGSLIVALAKQVHWKLIGVGLNSFGMGVGETTVLALSSFYDEVTMTAFSAGTGAGLATAPLYYTGR